MRIDAITLLPLSAKLKKAIMDEYVRLADIAGQHLVDLCKKHLSRTFAHWNESGENRFGVPTVQAVYKVNRTSTSIRIDVSVTVVDGSGQPHFLWHILSYGRKEYTFPEGKRSPPINKRRSRRTSQSLDADPFPGFTGERFVIHGGTRVKGVPGNKWYEAARDAVLADAASHPATKPFKIEAFVYQLRIFNS